MIEMYRSVLVIQGIIYILTGLWSVLSIGSFQAVTGPKRELWLVKTVGLLVTVIGGVLIGGAGRRRIPTELRVLSAVSAAVFAVIDLNYALRGRISKIYLLDAVAEIPIALYGALTWFAGSKGDKAS